MYEPYHGLREPHWGQLGKEFVAKKVRNKSARGAVIPSNVDEYDLECIAKDADWCVPFGVIHIVSV